MFKMVEGFRFDLRSDEVPTCRVKVQRYGHRLCNNTRVVWVKEEDPWVEFDIEGHEKRLFVPVHWYKTGYLTSVFTIWVENTDRRF